MSRDNCTQTIAKVCQLCSEPFIATGRQAKNRRYCSPLCKRAAAGQRAASQIVSTNVSTSFSAPSPAQIPRMSRSPFTVTPMTTWNGVLRTCPSRTLTTIASTKGLQVSNTPGWSGLV